MTGAKPRLDAWLPLAAALVSVILWASAFVGIRAAGRVFSPGSLALGRLTIGSLLLGGLTLTRPFVRPSRRDVGLLLLAGITWFGVYNLALNRAEQLVDAGTAAMIVLIAPLIILVLAALFLKEKTTPNLLLGGMLAFVGVAVIGFATSSGRPGRGHRLSRSAHHDRDELADARRSAESDRRARGRGVPRRRVYRAAS